MIIKKVDFIIGMLVLVATILLLDNLILSGIVFQFGDLHHETFIVAMYFAAVVIFALRKKLI